MNDCFLYMLEFIAYACLIYNIFTIFYEKTDDDLSSIVYLDDRIKYHDIMLAYYVELRESCICDKKIK